jgi:mannose-1-phosphate guanylyltransferase
LIPIILAGGKGERFWPLSRKLRPKQFLSLDGSGQSLLQATAARLMPMAKTGENLWVITAAQIAQGVREQLTDLPESSLLVEPQGRDTAPAVAWAVLTAVQRYGEDQVVGFFPADHWIGDVEAFHHTLEAAMQLAIAQPAIVTLGIQPTYPATGYGYIEQGQAAGAFLGLPAYRVNRFTEKPDRATAETFVESGRFSWNGGIFIFRAGVVLEELRAHAPEILTLLESRGVEAYGEVPKISIDYALMEKTQHAYVLPANFGWDDLGDWNAIARLRTPDAAQNVEVAHHIGLKTHNSLFYAADADELIVSLGLEDVIVVRDGHVTLVAHKDHTQDIKKVLKLLQDDPRFKDSL